MSSRDLSSVISHLVDASVAVHHTLGEMGNTRDPVHGGVYRHTSLHSPQHGNEILATLQVATSLCLRMSIVSWRTLS